MTAIGEAFQCLGLRVKQLVDLEVVEAVCHHRGVVSSSPSRVNGRGWVLDEATRARIAALRLRIEIAKAGPWDSDKHPRFPKGDPHGGKFAPNSGGLGDWLHNFFHKPQYDQHMGEPHWLSDPNWAENKGPQEPSYTFERKGAVLHPATDYKDRPVYIFKPNEPTPLAFKDWKNPDAVVTITPGAPVPKALNGVPFTPFEAPQDWRTVAGQHPQIEDGLPDLEHGGPGIHPAAGVIIQEPDGRVWLTKPTNGFGGYKHTFPKGTQEDGLTLQQTAIKEAWEETGLKVELVGVLGDFKRTTSMARYYIAKRVGGTPANQGWESQALRLVPPDKIISFLNMPVDREIWRTYHDEEDLTKVREPFVDHAALAALQARLDALVIKAGGGSYEEDKHPRWPKGTPLAGQYMTTDAAGIVTPPQVGSKANPSYANKVSQAYEAAKAGDLEKLHGIRATLHPKALQHGYKEGFPGSYGPHSNSQAKWALQSHQYVTHLISEQKSASFANLVEHTPDKGGTSVPSLTDYKKIEAKPGGSNPGAIYQGPDGNKYLVKGAKHPSADRAKNEVLASKLMNAAGVKAPDMHLVDLGKAHGGGLGVAAKMETLHPWKGTAAQKAAAQSEFATHAWLANYDAVGTPAGDNLAFTKDGKLFNYDPGGALLYRAQGIPKSLPGGMLATSASEWNSMRDKSINPAAHSIYGSMSASDLKASAEKLKNVDDKTITDLVAKYGPGTPEQKLKLAAVLSARRDDILAKAGVANASGASNVAAGVPKGVADGGSFKAHLDQSEAAPAFKEPKPKVAALDTSKYGDNISTEGKAALAEAKAHIDAYQAKYGKTASHDVATHFHDELANAKTSDQLTSAVKGLKEWNPAMQQTKDAKAAMLQAADKITVSQQSGKITTTAKPGETGSLKKLNKLGDAADKAINELDPTQTWASEALQAKMAIDHGIAHGDAASIADAGALLDTPKWANALGNGSVAGDAGDALMAYAQAADAHVQQYGGSNYDKANEERHTEAKPKNTLQQLAQTQQILSEATGLPVKHLEGPVSQQAFTAVQAFHAGDDKGMAAAMGTIATSGYSSSEKVYEKLHELASTKADQFPLSTGNAASIAADPSKPITGGATYKEMSQSEWKQVMLDANSKDIAAGGHGQLSVPGWTDFAMNKLAQTPGTPEWDSELASMHPDNWGQAIEPAHTAATKIYEQMQAKAAAFGGGGIAADAAEHAKPDAFGIKKPTVEDFNNALNQHGVGKTGALWADIMHKAEAGDPTALATAASWKPGASQWASATPEWKQAARLGYGYLEGKGAFGGAPEPVAPAGLPPMPNFQNNAKATAKAYYEGIATKMQEAHAKGDLQGILDAGKKANGKPIWPVYESGDKIGQPKTMNGKLMAEYQGKLTASLADQKAAATQAELTKPVGKIPQPGENKGNLPAMPDFEKAKLPSTNTNAPSHNKKVDAIAAAAASGDATAIFNMKFGTNTYGKKEAQLANDALSAMGVNLKVVAGQKPGSKAIEQAVSAMTDKVQSDALGAISGFDQGAKGKLANFKWLPGQLKSGERVVEKGTEFGIEYAKIEVPPKGLDPNGIPKPMDHFAIGTQGPTKTWLSSQEAVNQANNDNVNAIYEAGKAGDIKALENMKVKLADGTMVAPLNHKAKTVVNYYQQVLAEAKAQTQPTYRTATYGSFAGAYADVVQGIGNAVPPVPYSGFAAHMDKAADYLVLNRTVGSGVPIPPAGQFKEMTPQTQPLKGWRDLSTQAEKHLTSDERSAISSYVGSGYHSINQSLRDGHPNTTAKRMIAGFDKAAIPLPDGSIVWRGIGVGEQTYKSVIGAVIQDGSFQSTSYGANPAFSSHSTWLRIHVASGTKALGMHNISSLGEREVLLQNNIRYLVQKVTPYKDFVDSNGKHHGQKVIVDLLALPHE